MELANIQAEIDTLRSEEKAIYEETKPELEKAIAGIQKVLKVIDDDDEGLGDDDDLTSLEEVESAADEASKMEEVD